MVKKLDEAARRNVSLSSSRMGKGYHENRMYLSEKLDIGRNFDTIRRDLVFGGRKASIYFIDGFCKDELMQKILQYFLSLTEENLPANAEEMLQKAMPYVEVDKSDKWKDILYSVLSGVLVLMIEGFEECILIDSRTYPARSVEEPAKDKSLRGSKDGFVETVIFNTALLRRRIRSTDLCVEMMNAGKSSQTDIVLCYMDSRVDQKFLEMIKNRIKNIQVDALTLNQESLAECLIPSRWYNPFPKFKYTERPDAAAAQVLEGDIIIFVDNAPTAMIIPTSVLDIIEEADDYYFPPITGSYLRLSRMLIAIISFFLTPTYLLFMMHPEWLPETFEFVLIRDMVNIPLIWQFLLLELAIDGLRLAAVNTPNMLSTPLSIMAALVLGEFSVQSGWFNSEVMLYMAFVALANYTQPNYELGYAIKFMRIITLILTSIFGVYGYIAGIGILLISLINNKTVSGQSYLYPILPFDWKNLSGRIIRKRLPGSQR